MSGNALPFEKIILELKDPPIFVQDKKSYIFSFQTKFASQIYYHKSIVPLRKTGDIGQDPLYAWLQEYGSSDDERRLQMLEDQYEASGLYKHRPYKNQGTGEVKETDSLLLTRFQAVGAHDEAIISGIEVRPTAFVGNNFGQSQQTVSIESVEVPQSTSRRRIEDEISEEDSTEDIFNDIGVTEGTSFSKEKVGNETSSDVVADKEKAVDKKPAGRPPRKKASTSGPVIVGASKES
ncbi:hypothetical protein BGX21_005948 [Mortierella sp. AD011]|nr:hypothetical protein BGX21_005948 [Mortierella sp. AD011]